ncbi:hypothetical protein AKO1_014613 [Acrasis kona]|uniref:Uncharacterized protein n=1 Tax=Acrasis kona TaxID=1008807 RepID=A0AAW2Z2U2_9EUKA
MPLSPTHDSEERFAIAKERYQTYRPDGETLRTTSKAYPAVLTSPPSPSHNIVLKPEPKKLESKAQSTFSEEQLRMVRAAKEFEIKQNQAFYKHQLELKKRDDIFGVMSPVLLDESGHSKSFITN